MTRDQVFSTKEREVLQELSLSSPREQLVFSDLICGNKDIFYDNYYHRILTLKTLPEHTSSAFVEKLIDLPFSFYSYVHIRVPEQSKELSLIEMKRRMSHSMSLSQDGRVKDLESESQFQDTEDLLREIIETGQKIFFFQMAFKIKSKTQEEINFKSKFLLNAFRSLNGSEALEENVSAFKVFKTIIPFGNLVFARQKRIKADNLADFLPIYSNYEGQDQKSICLFRNRQNGLVSYDPFHSKLPNYNTLVTGSSGSGKSFLNNLILLQSMRENPITYIIDIGGSYRKLCDFLGGQYIDIFPPETYKPRSITINPFSLKNEQTSLSPRKIKFLLAFLESILVDHEDEKLSKFDKSLLEEAIDILYKKVKRPTLSDLSFIFQNSEHRSLKKFSKMLYSWTGDRPYGRLLDKEDNINLKNEFIVFDLKGLSHYPDLQQVMILIITDFVLDRIESKDKGFRGEKKRILIDECWELLKGKSSSHFMEHCVRTLRKSGAGITFITQGIEEIARHPIGFAIINNTATKFILSQKGNLESLQKNLKLDEKEISLISSLKSKKREYSEAFMISHNNKAIIRIYPSKEEYKIATTDYEDKIK